MSILVIVATANQQLQEVSNSWYNIISSNIDNKQFFKQQPSTIPKQQQSPISQTKTINNLWTAGSQLATKRGQRNSLSVQFHFWQHERAVNITTIVNMFNFVNITSLLDFLNIDIQMDFVNLNIVFNFTFFVGNIANKAKIVWLLNWIIYIILLNYIELTDMNKQVHALLSFPDYFR